MSLNNLFRKIEAIEAFDIQRETIDIINKNGDYITGLLRLQLQSGKDSEGLPVNAKYGPFYSDRTVFEKERTGVGLGKQTEWVTNYMSGTFYASLRTIAEGHTFKTESDVPYFTDILKRSGENIMKLNAEHLREFSEEILIPELKRRFKQLSSGV